MKTVYARSLGKMGWAVALSALVGMLVLGLLPGRAFGEGNDAAEVDTSTVAIIRATDCLYGCWRVSSVEYERPQASGPNSIYGRLVRQGYQFTSEAWHVVVEDADTTLHNEPFPDWSEYPMERCNPSEDATTPYVAFAGDDPDRSDHIQGLDLPTCAGMNFRILWHWQDAIPTSTVKKVWIPVLGRGR